MRLRLSPQQHPRDAARTASRLHRTFFDREPSQASSSSTSPFTRTKRRPPDLSRRRTTSRPLERFAMDASHRLLQTKLFQAPYGLFDSPLREEDSVDAGSLASVIAFSSPRSPLPCRAERESSAPPFTAGFPDCDQNRWRLRGSLWMNLPRLPFGGAAFAMELFRPQARSAAMPLAPSSRDRPSPDVRVENRALPSLRQERRPLSAPGAFARDRVRRLPRPLSRPYSAAPATPDRFRPCGAAPELLCPFDEGVSPPSPEPRFCPLNFSKERELGRGPLVELPAIVFSIREHDPRFADNPPCGGRSPRGDRAVGRDRQEPVRFRCPASSPSAPLARR